MVLSVPDGEYSVKSNLQRREKAFGASLFCAFSCQNFLSRLAAPKKISDRS